MHVAQTNKHKQMAANLKGQMEVVLKNLEVTLFTDKGKLTLVGAPMMKYPGLVTLGPSYGVLAVPLFGGTSAGGKFISGIKTNMFGKIVKEML